MRIRPRRNAAWVFAVVTLCGCALAQGGRNDADLSAATNAGRLEASNYVNDHIGIRVVLPQPSCEAKLNTEIAPDKSGARLLQCTHFVKGWKGMYVYTLMMEYRIRYPNVRNVDEYVAKLRVNGERYPGQKAAEPDQHMRMAGADFARAVLETHLDEGIIFKGVACFERRAYFLCFNAEAPTIDAVHQLLSVEGKLQLMDEHR